MPRRDLSWAGAVVLLFLVLCSRSVLAQAPPIPGATPPPTQGPKPGSPPTEAEVKSGGARPPDASRALDLPKAPARGMVDEFALAQAERYQKNGTRLKVVGTALLVVGAVAGLIGAITYLQSQPASDNGNAPPILGRRAHRASIGMLSVGGASFLSGSVIWSVGMYRLWVSEKLRLASGPPGSMGASLRFEF
jgi:hypothetical protein